MTLTEFHIGIDDTDSESGGCTTYTAAVLFQELCKRGVQPSDFPWLVRLNPNIPWKTRGNGALSLHIVADEDKLGEIQEVSLSIVGRTS
ncbi:MAG TPA: tRNA(Ile2) 2-agmatinylcytidine synthetase, partial [Candidatus Dormibacteraeota bacterium]|nr:tRNA(Ile2) 2-agmatinylcytidine synthetase [Candidatus Dormibacteraeota bacterium]